MFNTILVIAFALITLSSSAQVEILSEGLINDRLKIDTTVVIKNQEDLSKAWNILGIETSIPVVDFGNELVIAIVPDHKIGRAVKIVDIGGEDYEINIKYYVVPPTAKLKSRKEVISPFIVFKLSHLDPGKVTITFKEEAANVLRNTGLGKHIEYTNILEQDARLDFRTYFPLDRGNTWMYMIENAKDTRENTFSILSISMEGWSNFDRFFGKQDVAFKILRDNTLLVLADNESRPFYTPNVQKTFSTSQYHTPAGKFTDTMEITVPNDEKFWFRDVYAKDVGLILHEHMKGDQIVKYTLIKALIKGNPYPQVSLTPVKQTN